MQSIYYTKMMQTTTKPFWAASQVIAQTDALTWRELSAIMSECYGGTDAQNIWHWKTAYDAVEVAQILWTLDKRGNLLA